MLGRSGSIARSSPILGVSGEADARQSVALSRTAQAKVFALCVWFRRGIGRKCSSIALIKAGNAVAALPGGRMVRLLATLRRGFQERIGWKRVGIAASLVIIAFAISTLVRTLKAMDAGVMLVALTDIPPHHIVLAGLCVVCAFC